MMIDFFWLVLTQACSELADLVRSVVNEVCQEFEDPSPQDCFDFYSTIYDCN